MKLLNGANDWNLSEDLKTSVQFLFHIIQTEKRPNIVVWSDSKKNFLLIKFTVPREENWRDAHEQKKNRYETLRADAVENGWICHVIPIEVGSCRFQGHSHFVSFKNRNHWPQFESCLISSSDHGTICIKLNLVESDKSSAWMKYTRNYNFFEVT